MNKEAFLNELKSSLSGLPEKEIEERILFYSEIIDDRIEEGISEEEAVADAGSISDIVSQTLSDTPITKIVKERFKPRRSLRAFEIVLIIFGFPVWFPLLVTLFAVVFSLYVVVWAILISLWAVDLSAFACSAGGFILCALYFSNGFTLPGVAVLGTAIFCLGLSVLLFFAFSSLSKAVVYLTGKSFLKIKSLFIRKERSK